MDEVIADAAAEILKRYEAKFGERPTSAELDGRSVWQVIPESRWEAVGGFLDSDDFFSVLHVMPDAQRVLKSLQAKYEVFIATAAMEVPNSFRAKYDWLGRNFPFIPPSDIVFCGDKSILNADYLIDDNPRQLRRFRGQGVLFHSHHNAGCTEFPRVRNWLAVETMFLP
jgi:5'(3')-deoxyribonucleotidase